MNPGRTILTDRMWARIAPLCPGKAGEPFPPARPAPGQTGYP